MDVANKKQNFSFPQYDMLSLCIELGTAPENEHIVDLIPDFKTTLGIVKSKVDLVTILLAPGSQNTTGTAQQKRELKFTLADRIFEVSDPFAAYADGKGNDEWYTAFSKTIWVYRSMRPSMLISEADNIISTITPLLPQLSGTTINQGSLTAILDARNIRSLCHKATQQSGF